MKNTDNLSTNYSTFSLNVLKTKSHPFWRWFWLTFLMVSLAYAWYSFYVPSSDIGWANSMDSARELARDSNTNILLFFTGKWCVPCRVMKREVFADKEVMKAINSQFVPVIINIDDPNAEDLIMQYKVGTTPITIFTNPEGEVIDYAVGKIGKTKFLEMLKNLGTEGF